MYHFVKVPLDTEFKKIHALKKRVQMLDNKRKR